jgi:TRAP-type mannitol/chloroaromatic compound transport system permease small subunit
LPGRAEHATLAAMLNIGSLVIGVIALILAVFAFIPLLGWANWVIIPFAVVGLALGAMSDKTAGRNLNIVVIVIGVVRLMLGGGIF